MNRLQPDAILSFVDLPDARALKMARCPEVQVTLLGRLAIHQATKGQSLGEHLLLDAMHRSLIHGHHIAAMAVAGDTKSEEAARFYGQYVFKPLQAQPRKLFLPIVTIVKLLGE